MKKTPSIALLFILLSGFINLNAQQLPQFSQYGFNTIAVNPAYAGASDFFSVSLLNRNQWIGVNGAPNTQTISINSSIPDSKLGVGISAINDRLGFEKNTFIYADVSYTIDLGYRNINQLSLGLKAGASKFGLDQAIYQDSQNYTDSYLNSFSNKWHPNLGLGLYFRTNDYYLGLSVPKILDFQTQTVADYKTDDRLNYYLNGGYVIDINHDLKIKPTFLIKYVNGSPLAIDLNAFLIFNESLWLGANYRIKDAIGAIVKFKIYEEFQVGYAYEYTTSNLNQFSNGSHEVILIYQFKIRDCRCSDLYN